MYIDCGELSSFEWMDNGRDKPQRGPRPPGPGKIGVVPPQAFYHQTTGPWRVTKKTPALEDIFWFELSLLNVLQFFVTVLRFVFTLFWFKKATTMVDKCHRQGGLNG